MGALSPASAAAVARLRAYAPPAFPLWERMPPRRRGAVLVLLYPNRHGALRVVVTMRAAGLRTFPNQAALPGGKADSEDETACGLPLFFFFLLFLGESRERDGKGRVCPPR
jgi:8-oxo-dGTP pyrophosphatase MutT (NUDIX family)